MRYARLTDAGLEIDVLVVPKASRDRVGPVHDDRLKVSVTAPPVDGAANDAVCALLARHFGLKRQAVSVVRGHGSRRKTIRCEGLGELPS